MSKVNPLNKRRSSSFQNGLNEEKKTKPWHVAKVKNRRFQKSHAPLKAYKRSSPNHLKKGYWISKKLRRAIHKGEQPPTPHNTTQYIVDAVYYPTDPYIYEFDNHRFENNFQHHAMSGSMMELMQEKMRKDSEESIDTQGNDAMVEERQEQQAPMESSFELPKLRVVRSADDSVYLENMFDTPEEKNYDEFLKEAEQGKNLGDVIKQLVHVIKKKDNQINTLLANTQPKKEFLQES